MIEEFKVNGIYYKIMYTYSKAKRCEKCDLLQYCKGHNDLKTFCYWISNPTIMCFKRI